VHLQGFIVLDHLDRAPEFLAEVAPLVHGAQLQSLETVIDGFEELPTAINMLFDGTNVGKLLVRLAHA
jgi:NADPH-dependent curcumin reductase CurA